MNFFPVLRRQLSNVAQALRLKLNNIELTADEQGLITLPFERVVLPAGADPTLFQQLLNQVMQAAVQTSTQVQATVDQMRLLTQASSSLSYYVAEPAPGRVFRYDPTDTTSVDDGVLTLVDAAGHRYKAEIKKYVYITWLGVVPDGDLSTTPDASLAFLSLAQLLKSKGLQNKWIAFPNGRYRWETYVITNTDAANAYYIGNWCCPDGWATLVTKGTGGIWFSSEWTVRNIRVDGYGASPVLNAQNTKETDYRAYDYKVKCPVRVSMVCDFDYFEVNNAAGHAIIYDGNKGFRNTMFPNGSNSSCSHLSNYQFQGNGGSARYVCGPDENWPGVDDGSYNAVDGSEIYFNDAGAAGCSNNGWGPIDRSFLGCRVNNQQGNANLYEHNIVDDPNAIASLRGIYEEDTGTKSSRVEGSTLIEGRLTLINGQPRINASSTWIKGRSISHITTSNLTLNGGGTGVRMAGSSGSFTTSFLSDTATHLVEQLEGETRYVREVVQQGATILRGGLQVPVYRSAYVLPFFFFGLQNNVEEYATSLSDSIIQNIDFVPGDRVRLLNSRTWLPEYYVTIQGGKLSTGTAAYAGVTANVNANERASVTTSIVPTMFTKGDYIRVGEHTGRIMDIIGNKLITNGYFDGGSLLTIYHVSAIFQARGGHLSGIKANMPGTETLSSLDAGLCYYATDEQKNYRWSGTAFALTT